MGKKCTQIFGKEKYEPDKNKLTVKQIGTASSPVPGSSISSVEASYSIIRVIRLAYFFIVKI
jgi:hypothetical protein